MAIPITLQRYPYTYLRTIMMKRALLGKDDYDKLLKMSSDEIGKFIEDMEYKKEIDELGIKYSGNELVERALQLNLSRTFTKLLKISPPELRILVALYVKRYDMNNIKTVLRAAASGVSAEQRDGNLSPIRTFDDAFYDKLLAQKTVEDICGQIKFIPESEWRKALDLYKKENTLTGFDFVLDKYYYSNVLSQIRFVVSEGQLFKRFLKSEIDVLNIRVLLQMKKGQVSDQDIKEYIFGYGYLSSEFIGKVLKSDQERILKELEQTYFQPFVERYTKSKEASLLDLDIELDHFLAQQAQKLIRQFPLSVDVILGYLFLKDIEVRNITRIVKAKELGLEEKDIEKMVLIA